MQKVVIKVINAAVCTLFIKNCFQICRIFKITQRHFCGKFKGAARMPLNQRFADGFFALVTVIGIGGIKIGKTKI